MSTETFNFQIGAMGDQEREPCNFNVLTLEKLYRWIDNQELIDEAVKEELKKKANTYPQSALPNFKKNFKLHLAKAQKIVKNKIPLNSKPEIDHFTE